MAVVSVGSASERKHGTRRSPERVSRRTRHPESASRRDTTIERRMRARATRAFDAERVARIVASPRRKLELGRGHRGSRAISWSPPAPGGQPSARVRLRERGAPWPRRDRDARARARREENRRAPCGQPEHGRSTKRGAARRERSRARAPKRAREERNIKVMPRRARRTCGVVGERAYALRARKCRGARGGVPSGIDTRFVGTKKNAQLCVVV